jgi:hypothetical protein
VSGVYSDYKHTTANVMEERHSHRNPNNSRTIDKIHNESYDEFVAHCHRLDGNSISLIVTKKIPVSWKLKVRNIQREFPTIQFDSVNLSKTRS